MDLPVLQPIISFATAKAVRVWFKKNHTKSDGMWLRFFKKATGKKTVSYAEALDEALCVGWIDGQVKKYDEQSWIQKFTPRRKRSLWSKRNKEHVARLISEKRIQPAGLAAIAAAKKDGRWESAYDSPKNMQVPMDFLRQIKKNKKAHEFFKTLNKSNTYAIAWHLQTARKPETRRRRMEKFLQMLAQEQKLY
jgi:uncharacterized protein YdeI (YjbR/CyaY-like superfamily)